MPCEYAAEMVADWYGAGKAINGTWEAHAWYEKVKEKMILHPRTRGLVEEIFSVYGGDFK
jgi:hypothetical protein